MGTAVRTVIHWLPGLFGSAKGPVYTAPGASVIVSPGWAAFRAACRFPPEETAMICPVGGT